MLTDLATQELTTRQLRHRAASLLAFALLSAVPAAAQVVVSDPGQGAVQLPAGAASADELSALAHDTGTRWLAVSDNAALGAKAFELTISLAIDGTISSATVDAALPLAAGGDPEGLALLPGTLFMADEAGPAIHRFDPADGSLLGAVSVPAVFSNAAPNLSLESLALTPAGGLWTANEEALLVDGPASTFGAGTTVRLQRFDAAFTADGQWAYTTDPLPADVLGSAPGRDIEASGVSEVVVLDDDTLLVLERAVGGDSGGLPITRSRLYAVDLAGATDTSAFDGLDGETFTPVSKTLLWEGIFPVSLLSPVVLNFEGASLGPRLNDGSRSLILVADDGQDATQALYPLTLSNGLIFGDGLETGGPERWSTVVPAQ